MSPIRKLELTGVLVLVAAVLALAFWPARPIHENVTPAAAVRQVDGSLIAERAPAASAPAPRAMIPAGAVRERSARIVVAPAPGASSVEVDTELVRMDNQRRLIVSSPDGQVLTAVDVPVDPAPIPPPPTPWAAGLSYGTDRAVGIWVDRDVGRLVLGVAASRLPDGRLQAQVRAGVRF